MKKTYTCIICPNGCDITVEAEGRQILSVEGNKCAKGEEYVSQEIIAPKRTITTSVAVEGGSCPLASVRLTRAIAKEKIFEVMDVIKKLRLQAAVEAGSVVLHNVCGLDSDVMVTRSVEKR